MSDQRRRRFLLQTGAAMTVSLGGCGPKSETRPLSMAEAAYALSNFKEFNHKHGGVDYEVYASRNVGPAVIVMHELNGMNKGVVEFAKVLIKNGYKVYLPLFFGKVGVKSNGTRNIFRICIRRQMNLFSKGQPSTLTDWLRSLCRYAHSEAGGAGVGVLGMCLTGGFVIPMMIDESVIAAVAAQPSLPLLRKHQIDSDQETLELAANNKQGAPLLSIRYSEDRISTFGKHERLAHAFCGTPLPVLPDWQDKVPGSKNSRSLECEGYKLLELKGRGHSTLTTVYENQKDLLELAEQSVLEFFNSHLSG